MLSLRILTLTDDEKREMAATRRTGPAAAGAHRALGRADLMRLHGVLRQIRALEEAP